MVRALAVLTCGAFLTLVIGVVGAGKPVLTVVLGGLYTVLATVGFAWVHRRDQRAWSVAYVAAVLALAGVVFALDPGAGSTLFLVVLVSQCVLLLPLPYTVVVILIVPMVHVGMTWWDGLREGFGTLAAVVFAAVVTELLRREQQTRRALVAAHEQLRDYALQAERLATAQERNRVARDIHDGLGHALTVVQMQVKAARAVLPPESAADPVLAKAQEQAQTALAEVRRSVRALRGPRLDPPLPEALQALAEETSAAGVPTRLAVSGTARPLPDDTREALFRAAQEGLTNARKHADAGRIDLTLDYADTAVCLEVRDDGAGLSPPRRPRVSGSWGCASGPSTSAGGARRAPPGSGLGAADRGAGVSERVTTPVRVLLVDDQALFREALAVLLGVRADIEVVGEAADGAEALHRAAELAPDVVLMDLHMPVLNGIAATRRMRVEHPAVRVIALTTFDDDEEVFAALRAGAVGYLLKDVSSARLVEAVLAAARGESVLQPSVAAKVVARFAQLPDAAAPPPPQPLVVPLSERELAVLRLLADGESNREIAAALFLAEGTVKNHVTNVLAKLGARDRTQAALRARALDLL